MSIESQLNTLCSDARNNFHKIFAKSVTIMMSCGQQFGENDGRFMFFSVYTALHLWLLLTLDSFIEMLDIKDKKFSKYLTVQDPNFKSRYLIQHDQFNRIAYATKAMFEVEIYVKILMNGLHDPARGKYFDFTKDFLKKLEMSEPQKHKIINAPYQLRNSLHNNGYVYHDFDITLRGTKYIFEKGKQLDFTGWNHLFIFFDELTDLLIEMTNNPIIKNTANFPHTYDMIDDQIFNKS